MDQNILLEPGFFFFQFAISLLEFKIRYKSLFSLHEKDIIKYKKEFQMLPSHIYKLH